MPSSMPIRTARAERHRSAISVKILVDRVTYDAVIKDISILGCCLSGDFDLAKGDEITILLDDDFLVATVAWVQPSLAGANFHREIAPLQMIRDYGDDPMLTRRLPAQMMQSAYTRRLSSIASAID